jgi:hypothetical protein
MLDLTKETLVGIASLIPGAGVLAGAFVSFMWTVSFGKKDVWDTIRDRVKEYVDAEMLALWKSLMSGNVARCQGQVEAYSQKAVDAAKEGASENKKKVARDGYYIAEQHLSSEFKVFQDDKKYDWVTLPLFVQFANLHIALIRDMVHNADVLGFPDDAVATEKEKLKKLVEPWHGQPAVAGKYYAYAWNTYLKGTELCYQESYERAFRYQRVMYPAAMDYVTLLWPRLSLDQEAPKSVKRAYTLWAGPYGPTRSENFKKWFPKTFPHPIDGDAFDEAEAGIYWSQFSDSTMLTGEHSRVYSHWDDDDIIGIKVRTSEWTSFGNLPDVDKMWFATGTTSLDAIAYRNGNHESCWYGSRRFSKSEYLTVGTKGWYISRIGGETSPNKDIGHLLIGYRPKKKELHPQKIKPLTGRSYRLHSMSSGGGVLDLKRCSASDGLPASLEVANGDRTQTWRMVSTDESESSWHLMNCYSSRFLAVRGGEALQTAAGPGESPPAWELTRNTDATWSLRAEGTSLTEALGGEGEDRWMILPDIPPPGPTSGTAPELFTEDASTDGRTALRLTLRNPGSAAQHTDWRLTFTLPDEAGPVALGTDPVAHQLGIDAGSTPAMTLAASTPTERGNRIELTASADGPRTLTAGAQVSCVLVTDETPADLPIHHVVPDDIRFNDTRLTF